MIPTCRDEILTCPAETDFTPRLHAEINFRPGKTGQFSTCYIIILHINMYAFSLYFFFFCKHIIIQNLENLETYKI